MIRKSVKLFFLGTNAKLLPGDHANSAAAKGGLWYRPAGPSPRGV
jgi:hypothetical protein